METTNFLVSDSVNQTERIAVRQTVTGLEQGVAAIGGLLTAGPLGSLAAWSDGYSSSYVFWSNGQAEIFSKDGTGKNIRTAGKFERLSNGSIKIAAETNETTIFPSFNPATN